MKVLSINVNNFGGINPKPLPKDYKLSNGGNDWKAWEDAVDNWRDNNRDIIGKNVNAIADLAWDFDVAFFYEVDTNCFSWELLSEKMGEKYLCKLPNGMGETELKKWRQSISCAFIKKGINYEYSKKNILKDKRTVEIKVADTYIIGLHMSYCLDDWEKLIERFKELKTEKFLIVGDLNVFDSGTDRRKKFDELLECGAIDIWTEQGGDNNIFTANTNKRIDYALATDKLFKAGVSEWILNHIRKDVFTDHAAIAVVYGGK